MHSIQNVRYFCLRIILQFYFFSNSYKKNFSSMHHASLQEWWFLCLSFCPRKSLVPYACSTHVNCYQANYFQYPYYFVVFLSYFLVPFLYHIFYHLATFSTAYLVSIWKKTSQQISRHSNIVGNQEKTVFFLTKRTIITLKRSHAQKWDFEKERKSGKKKKTKKEQNIRIKGKNRISSLVDVFFLSFLLFSGF